MARLLVNVAPLRESRDFRLLFGGQLASMFGSQLTLIAVPFQVYHATHSSLWVGLVYLIQLPLLVVGSIWGGAVGDRVDRRTLLVITAVVLSVLSALLALNAQLPHPYFSGIVALAALSAGVAGFANPARNAAIPRLVRREQLVAAYSINQIIIQISSVVGPAVAGLLISAFGLSACYWIDAGTFLVLVAATWAMSPIRPLTAVTATSTLRSIAEGMRYLRTHVSAQCVYLVDLNAMIFGMPISLFPELALRQFHGGAATYGLLVSAPAAGALLAAATTGWVERIARRGRAVVVAVALWGLAIALFGFTSVEWLALVLLAVAGGADVISAVLRNTILQSSITDEYRGRMSAIQMAVVQGGPRLGNFEASSVRAFTSVEFSIVSGGIACIVGAAALVGWRKQFWSDVAEI